MLGKSVILSFYKGISRQCRRTLKIGGSDDLIGSMQDLRVELAKHVLALQKLSTKEDKKVDHSQLDERKSKDSRDRVVVPLGKNEELKLKYLNPMGHIRFGRILEDLDTFAVWLSYRHNQGIKNHAKAPAHHPMVIVTACVDRIDLKADDIHCDQDLAVEGGISYVGRSSMEATIHISQERQPKHWSPVLEAKFVMVALHPATLKTVPVHPLKPETHDEKELYDQGKRNNNERKTMAENSLLKMQPTVQETALQHQLFLNTIDKHSHTFRSRVLPSASVWMEDSKLKNVVITFPEQKNLYNKVFGGFLMRQAFELAWANACVFSRTRPALLAVDDIMFEKSVPVGSLLYLSSEVCYTEGHSMQIRVHAEIVDPIKGTQETSNTFHFTFATRDASNVKTVMPRTYADGMLYLSGKRHFDEAMKHRTTPG